MPHSAATVNALSFPGNTVCRKTKADQSARRCEGVSSVAGSSGLLSLLWVTAGGRAKHGMEGQSKGGI